MHPWTAFTSIDYMWSSRIRLNRTRSIPTDKWSVERKIAASIVVLVVIFMSFNRCDNSNLADTRHLWFRSALIE